MQHSSSSEGPLPQQMSAKIPTNAEPVAILLIEDTATDALLTRIALDHTRIPYSLRTLCNGSEAATYIMGHTKFDDTLLPDVILLDLGLPTMNGFEVLDMLSAAPASIRSIPIIILTGYEHFEYLSKTSNLFIPAYMAKPCNPVKIREVLMGVNRQRVT